MSDYKVNRKRWDSLDIFSMLGNIYSEVGRAFSAKARYDLPACEQAKNRAIDLFDATIDSLTKKQSPQAREVTQAKQQFLEVLANDKFEEETFSSLDRYFYHFAVAARLHR